MDYLLKNRLEDMDFVKVTSLLTQAYWSLGIQYEEVVQVARNSTLVVGAFTLDGAQIAYTRAVSDRLRFGYVADVIVDPEYRGQGLGKALLRYLLADPILEKVRHWLLVTRDAQELYKKIGFQVVARPLDWMEYRPF